jgi:hypothetical protein
MFTFGLLRDGVLFVVGLGWLGAMFRRMPRDLDVLRESRVIRDWAVIAVLWGITAFVLVCMLGASLGVVRSIANN